MNAEQEDRFRKTNFGADITLARIFIFLTMLPFVALVVNDYGFFGFSWMFYGLLALRLAIVTYTILFLKSLRGLPNYRSYDRAELIWALFLALTHITVNATRPENFVAHAIVTVLAVFVMVLAIPNRFTNQLILSLVYTVGGALIIAPSLWASPQASFTVLLSMFTANAIAIASSWLLHFWRRREFLTREEIQEARVETEMQLTERRRMEEALKKSESSLAEAQHIAHIGNWEWNIRTGEVRWSDELYSIYEVDTHTFSPTISSFADYVHPDDREFVDQMINQIISGDKSVNFDFRITSANGSMHTLNTIAEVTDFDENGKPSLIVGITQDITERKQEEHRIRRYNSVLEGINRIFGSVVRAETEEELGNSCLSVALEVTGSQIGFIGEIGVDGLLQDVAISDMGWSQCLMYDKTGHHSSPGDFILQGLYGCVIDTRKSFFTNNPRSYPDSIGPPQGHPALTSFLGVPLTLDGKMVGMLAVANREGGYSYEQQEDLEAIAPAVTQALQRKKIEKALEKIDIARQKEIHHRIKNNLQVISSLLDLQAEKFNNKECIKDSEVFEAFRESQDRVISMALIHEELHESSGFEILNFSPYLEKLAESLFRTYRLGNIDISLNMDLEEKIFFNMDTAVPLGIIINELVSNSLKHAFQGRDKGEIRIKLRREENGECISSLEESKNEDCTSTSFILIVSDNGVGIPENLEIEDLNSLGLQLVISLVDQLDGEIELKRDKGTEFTIWFTNIVK